MVLSARCPQRDVISLVEDHFCLGQHRIVLDFGFSDGGAVIGEDDEFGLSRSEGSEGGLVAENVPSTFHDEGELTIEVFSTCFFHH